MGTSSDTRDPVFCRKILQRNKFIKGRAVLVLGKLTESFFSLIPTLGKVLWRR